MIFFPSLLIACTLFVQANARNIHSHSKRQDKKCSDLMCITATVTDSTTEYILASTGAASVGWMAIGFGTSMLNADMVIMWANTDGTVTLSQRATTVRTEPKVVSNPPRIATVSTGSSVTTGSAISLAFTIPTNSDTTQNIVYAVGGTNPGSSDPAATLFQHFSTGYDTLSLVNTGTATGTSGTPVATGAPSSGDDDKPLTKYQKMIIVHGICSVVGFLLLLPLGSLIARYARTFTPVWFTTHWISQFLLSGPIILVGFAFGVASVAEVQTPHFSDGHKRMGLAIFILYLVQCSLGAGIHFIKRASSTGRPPQNYIHAVVGILIIALAFAQVHSGYKTEWKLTGLDAFPKSVNNLWTAWVVIIPVLYAGGLSLLPRQYKQEAAGRNGDTHKVDNRSESD